MSWDILLIKTKTNTEEMDDITPEILITHSKQEIINVITSLGEVIGDDNIKLNDSTYVEYFITEDEFGDVLTIHFQIRGKKNNIKIFLDTLLHQFGGRFYDVSSSDFISLEKID